MYVIHIADHICNVHCIITHDCDKQRQLFAATSETTETGLSVITMTTDNACSTALTHIVQYSSIRTQLTFLVTASWQTNELYLYVVLSIIIGSCTSK